jgi:hypothetical protein
MCIQIRTLHACGHSNYQNTHLCHVARRCDADSPLLLLASPVHLPGPPSRVPPGLFTCQLRVATRPVQSQEACGACVTAGRRRARERLRDDIEGGREMLVVLDTAGTGTSTGQTEGRGESGYY